jgi:multidrug efflux pump subunit AcrB
MWIVRLALRRPYTFTVMALLILILGILAGARMAKDIFPSIDIPVVTVLWSYNGLTPEEMERRIVTISERAMTTTVNDIEHLESQSLSGIGVIKIFFQPGASVDAAVAQVTAINQTIVRVLPPGTTPPLVIRYSASNVPILQLGLGSKTLNEQTLYDLAANFLGAAAFGWQATADPDRPRSAGFAGEGPHPARCQQCHQRTKPHAAFWHG